MTFQIDLQTTCNQIADTFFHKVPRFNGCVISFRLHNEDPDGIDDSYHIAYCGTSNYKLLVGIHIIGKLFLPDKSHGKWLSHHDSAWRYDSYIGLESIMKAVKYRKVTIEEITPVNWVFKNVSGDKDKINVEVMRCEGRIFTEA